VKRERIFISYRRADTAGHAGRLSADLTRLLGPRVFMDVSSIAPGDEFERVIDEQLRSCGAVLAIIGPEWRAAFAAHGDEKDYVRLELRQALQHEGVVVIPVLVRGASLPAEADLPRDVQAVVRRQAVAIRDDRWEDDVAHLARSLRTELRLSRLPRWLLPAATALVAAVAVAAVELRPPAPGPFDRHQAYELTIAAARKAMSSCGVAAGVEGECPVLLEFVPSGRVRKVYFDTGSCRYKGSPFGDCVLGRLERASIPPFDDVESAQLEIGIRIDANGAPDAFVDE
jgi:TIR domain-containing protein